MSCLQTCFGRSDLDLINELNVYIKKETDILELDSFHFEEARELFKKFKEFGADKEAIFYEEQKKIFNVYTNEGGSKNKTKYENFLESLNKGSEEYQFFELMGKLIAHIDAKASNKKSWNPSNVTIADSGVHHKDWVINLLRYKEFKNDISKITAPSIKNAIIYIEDPGNGLTLLSEEKRKAFSNKILKKEFNSNSFVKDCLNYFNDVDVPVKTQDNKTFYISTFLYQSHIEPTYYHAPKKGGPMDKKEAVKKGEDETDPANKTKASRLNEIPLNQILYGPPGTGKTYTTIDKALEILVPGFLEEVKEEATEDNDKRKKLKARYDNLAKEGRIFFVTFHQSFSYEDFIEGIKATTTAEGISYTVESGIFKKACEASKKRIDGVDTNELLKQFIEEIAETSITLKTPRGKNFDVTYRGDNTTITCLPHASKEKRELPAIIAHIKQVMCDIRPENIYCESYVNGIVNHIKTLSPSNSVNKESDLPIILIIDEINRGNISSIFGEMITLIEPSKRAGAAEELSVQLPYSKEKFQVPKNLYLIGTMNTADRSLALLDTALRRRFDFEEMLPNTDLLKVLDVKGIDVSKMLSVINKRIEVLYDREHTLGHAFFMPLLLENDSEIQFKMLQNIFENKILPLLEEYFFEDWEKIQLVLGDNQKKNKNHQFIILNKEGYVRGELFGSEVDDKYSEKDSFRRNLEAFKEVDSYIGIYEKKVNL